jgi:hypothetical protein
MNGTPKLKGFKGCIHRHGALKPSSFSSLLPPWTNMNITSIYAGATSGIFTALVLLGVIRPANNNQPW